MANACQCAGAGRRWEPTGIASAAAEALDKPASAEAATAAARQIAAMPDAADIVTRIERLPAGEQFEPIGPPAHNA